MPLDFVSDTDQKVPFYVNPRTAGGKPAKLDGKVEATITEGGATFEPATDEQIAAEPTLVGFFVSEDTEGVSKYKIVGDADLGEGVVSIEETGTYNYSAAAAISVGASAGSPVFKA